MTDAAEAIANAITSRAARTPKRKYRNKPITRDGIRFDSQKEAERWAVLRMIESAGLITDLRRQVRIPLLGKNGPVRFQPSNRAAVYVADFAYFDVPKGVEVIEDTKGYQTQEFKLKRAVLAAQGVEIVLT